MDRDLAQTIFRIISTSKPEYSPPLERVSFAIRNLEYVDLANFRGTNTHWSIPGALRSAHAIHETIDRTTALSPNTSLRSSPTVMISVHGGGYSSTCST
jgi:hypothetical protein